MVNLKYKNIEILDIFVFIGATALAMATTRHWWEGYFESFRPGGEAYQMPFPDLMYQLRDLLYSFSYFAATWSLACLLLGLRQPRPALRLVFRQPGMAACLAAVIVLTLQLINLTVSLGLHVAWFPDPDDTTETEVGDWLARGMLEELPMIPSAIGYAVAATWIVLAMSGRWRPKAYWIDRVGRILGFFWMATMPFSWFSWNTE